MRSIWLIVLLDTRAARATSSRVFHGGDVASGAASASAVSSTGRSATRAVTISFFCSASTPRWKSDTLRRARWLSIIHSMTSSMVSKLLLWTVRNGMPCCWQIS